MFNEIRTDTVDANLSRVFVPKSSPFRDGCVTLFILSVCDDICLRILLLPKLYYSD